MANRTEPDKPQPTIRARYGRRAPSVEGQVRTMLGEIADRLERNRPDEELTATARIAVIQATTMDPVLGRALRIAAPEVDDDAPVTRTAYAARLREITAGGDAR